MQEHVIESFEIYAQHALVDLSSDDLLPGKLIIFAPDNLTCCSGGDIHVSTDGNRHHRRLKSAGEGPAFYTAKHFVSKEFVDQVGDEIAAARKRKPKATTPKVPNEAIDECEKSHYAAKDDHKGTDFFDDQGIMSLVCRHDVPLFVANVDTPGEEQKYAVALIKHLCSLLPPTANITVLYDIGCVLDRSLELVGCYMQSMNLPLTFSSMISYPSRLQRAFALPSQPCTPMDISGRVRSFMALDSPPD